VTHRRLGMVAAVALATSSAVILFAGSAAASDPCFGSAATITGTAGDDPALNGTAGDDVINGAGGNDVINGLGGNDKICGDTGNDTIDGGAGSDQLDGEVDTDTVTFVSVTSQLTANLALGTASQVNGDTATILNFENLTGQNSFDTLTGDGGPNTLTGLDAPDGFRGGGGNDVLIDDTDDVAFQDTAIYNDAGPGGITAHLDTPTKTVVGDGLGTDTLSAGIPGLQGSNFADTIVGDGNNNPITAGGGNDFIQPLGGADSVVGEGGTDTIVYSTETGPIVTTDLSSGDMGNVTAPGGNDSVFEVENLIGSAQDDQITGGTESNVFDGRGGADQLNGGSGGSDTASFSGISAGVTASLLAGTATGQGADTLTNMDNLTGSPESDVLTGNDQANVIDGLDSGDGLEGRGGDDTLADSGDGLDELEYGSSPGPGGIIANLTTGTVNATAAGAGTDTVSGVAGVKGTSFLDQFTGDGTDNLFLGRGGNDSFAPLGGADFVNGEAGTDLIDYSGETGPIVTADLSSGDPGNVMAPGGNDQVFGVENLTGTAQNDQITGGTESNSFVGGGGDDQLNGGAGGSDTASFAGASAGVIANLAPGTANGAGTGTDTLTNIDNLTGSGHDDLLTGDLQDNILNGGAAGSDTALFNGLDVAVNANLALGTAVNQGSDTLFNIDNLTGSSQGDTLVGNEEPNSLSGVDGADNITGGLGADGFFLGAGADVIAADDGEVDVIDCEGGGPDSGTVDGPAPAENYITDCNTDGDALIDFFDACPSTSGTGADGCVPSMNLPPVQMTPTTPAAPPTKKKCKKKKKRAASVAKKKKCKKKRK
jgi:Ca2+-binding RTX toxin-like protein